MVGYRQLMSGTAVDNAPALHFQQRIGIEIAHEDAQDLGVATGDRLTVDYQSGSITGPAVVLRSLRQGVVRLATPVPYIGPGTVKAALEDGRWLTASSPPSSSRWCS